MGTFSDTTYSIMDWLQNHGAINEVTFGDANEVDIAKATTFPLVHVIPLTSTTQSGYTTYNYQILFLSTFKSSNEDKIEVLDGLSRVVEDFIRAFNNKTILNHIVTSESTSADIIYDQRQNRLYGWTLDLSVNVPNTVPC